VVRLGEIPTPALVVDLGRLDANLERMAAKARRLGVALRPHLKTHKCAEIARRQAALGCRGVTVSTLEEAHFFAEAGFDDLTWAFPIIPSRLPEARSLAERVSLGVVVDSDEAIAMLEAQPAAAPWRTWLKVDCGYHRAGVEPTEPRATLLARRLADSPAIDFRGLLTHSGHAYAAADRQAMAAVARQERDVTAGFADRLRGEGVEVPEVSVGSTPALSVDVGDYPGVTEVRPGNYVFYDYTQVVLGSCRPADCAVTVLASVVSSSRERRRSVVDAGALALSKDTAPPWAPRRTFGELFEEPAAGRLDPARHLLSLSQEHGVVDGWFPVGNRVRILPNHSCLTVACFDEYWVAQGDEVVDRWRIHRRRS
jgi:D-serine deaminase-like pyridoxal phosphate-dependent protein